MSSHGIFARIDTVFLPVRALDTAVAWYTDVLGQGPMWANECVAAFKLGETAFTLVQHGYPGMAEAPEGHVFRPQETIAFNLFAPDLEAARALLSEKGAQVGPMLDHGALRELRFADPDGNRLSVVSF